MAQIRPWIDPIAVSSRGIVTSYISGVIRNWIDSVAIQTQGRKTSYAPGEGPGNYFELSGSVESSISISGSVESSIPISGEVY